ncbi:MAG: PAS domain-containing protein [Myxococcales bacterium]|nr:PAS domain-containing protein [Myxococcales bacterium]
MTAQDLPARSSAEDFSARRLLEGLSRVYRWVLVVDAQRRVLWASEAFSEVVAPGEEVLGRDASRFIPLLPHPDQIFKLNTKLKQRPPHVGLTLGMRTSDGVDTPVEVHLVRIDTDESAPHLLAIARPSEQGASVDLAPAHSIVDEVSEAVVLVDPQGFVTFANRAALELFDLPRNSIEGSAAALLFGSEATSIGLTVDSLIGRQSGACELSLLRPDGSHCELLVRASSLEPGMPGTMLCLRDLSASDREQRALLKVNEELEYCVNALAHDLRSPLVALLGFSRLLRQDYAELLDASGLHFLDRIEQAGVTMESLIHDLLELSRIESPAPNPSRVDCRSVLVQLAAEFKPRLEDAGIRLVFPDAPPPIRCDRTRLYQVVSNLIGNAVEHMGEVVEPRIEVEVLEREAADEIVISDNGQGIGAESHQAIFEVFHRLGRRPVGAHGAGIGLAIVRKIAESHGGRVWVESESGKGAAFHVLFPR